MQNVPVRPILNHHRVPDISLSHQRDSYFEVIDLFGPTIYTLVTSRHRQRDMQLVAEAENAIDIHLAGGTPEPNVELKTLLELQTVLCTEYRCAQPNYPIVTFISHQGIHTSALLLSSEPWFSNSQGTLITNWMVSSRERLRELMIWLRESSMRRINAVLVLLKRLPCHTNHNRDQGLRDRVTKL